MTQRIDTFLYDSKNWTFFDMTQKIELFLIWIWLKELNSFWKCDSKSWFFFQKYDSKNCNFFSKLWLKELNLLKIWLTELNFFSWLKELNPFSFWVWLKELNLFLNDSKIEPFFSNTTQRIEPSSDTTQRIEPFSGTTQRIEPFFILSKI